MRRFQLLLPINHPLFDLPPGQRARKAREWLERGMKAESESQGVEKRLEAVEKKLAELEKRLEESASGGEKRKEEKNTNTLSFDPASFGQSLLDVF